MGNKESNWSDLDNTDRSWYNFMSMKITVQYIMILTVIKRVIPYLRILITATCIYEFSYRAWHFITSFIDYAIQIYVGQKARENQWRVMVIEEFLHTALLYQASNTRNINAVAVLEQYLVLVEKE